VPKLTQTSVKAFTARAKPYDVRDSDLKGFLLRVGARASVFYFQYRNPQGKQQSYRIGELGTITVTQARDVAQRLAGRVALGEDVHASKSVERQAEAARKRQTLGGFITEMYAPDHLAHRPRGRQTLADLKHHFGAWYDKSMADLSVWLVDRWKSTELKAGRKPATINRNLTTLKAALSKAVAWGVIEAHPLTGSKRLKEDNRPKVRYLSDDERVRLFAALRVRDARIKTERASGNAWRKTRHYEPLPDLFGVPFADHLEPMITLALNTGVRRGELFALRWRAVDLDRRVLTVEGASAKSGHTRHIPLNAEAMRVLAAWRSQAVRGEFVFTANVDTNGNSNPFDNVNKGWRALLRAAGISDFRWHDMRHDFASQLVMRGAPLNTVRDLLGHADLAMTLRYAHLAPEAKASAVGLLDSPTSHVEVKRA
jgi:integrase